MANPSSRGQQRDKPFRDALRAEIAAAQGDDDFKSLRRIARELLKSAGRGDVQAIREVADRLDGKVPQAHIGGDDDDPAVKVIGEIKYTIVDPKPRSTESIPAAT
jgi:hypothetical protein